MSDFTVNNQGTIFLLAPQTIPGHAWVDDYLPDDAQWFGNAVVVEHRYIGPIIEGIVNDGLTVEEI